MHILNLVSKKETVFLSIPDENFACLLRVQKVAVLSDSIKCRIKCGFS